MFYAWIKSGVFVGVSECHLLDDDAQNVEITEAVYNDALEFGSSKYEWNGKELVERYDYATERLAERRASALSRIDSATSTAILAGFDYTINGEVLHFSYDSFDQQNFADSANVATLALSGGEGLPTSVMWNAYRNYTPETGGELVRVEFTPQTFLGLYMQGALAHKGEQMEIGGQRKAAVEAAQTVEEIEALLQEWGIA